MNDFVSRPPTPAPPAAPSGGLIEGGWWPDIDLDALRALVRVDPAVTAERLRQAVLLAIVEVRGELRLWAAELLLLGHESLAAAPAEAVGGVSRYVILYREAVHQAAAARLLHQLRDIGLTRAGHDRADELVDTAVDHAVLHRLAIRDLLGRARTTVDLI